MLDLVINYCLYHNHLGTNVSSMQFLHFDRFVIIPICTHKSFQREGTSVLKALSLHVIFFVDGMCRRLVPVDLVMFVFFHTAHLLLC